MTLKADGSHPALPLSGMHAAVNQELVALVSFLSASQSLRTLSVAVHGAGDDEEAILKMLRPLACIPSSASIQLCNVSKTIKDQIAYEQSNCTKGKHFFLDFQQTTTNLRASKSFRHSFRLEDYSSDIFLAKIMMDNAYHAYGFVDEDYEKRMRDATMNAKRFLHTDIAPKADQLADRNPAEVKIGGDAQVDEIQALNRSFSPVVPEAKEASKEALTGLSTEGSEGGVNGGIEGFIEEGKLLKEDCTTKKLQWPWSWFTPAKA